MNELLDINYIVGSALVGIVGGAWAFARWIVKRMEEGLRTDRHAMGNKLQVLESKLEIANLERRNLETEMHGAESIFRERLSATEQRFKDKLEFAEKLMMEIRKQLDLKDIEIVKLRDQVAQYTKILIQRGVEDERRLKGRVDADGESLPENVHLHGTIESAGVPK